MMVLKPEWNRGHALKMVSWSTLRVNREQSRSIYRECCDVSI